MEPQTPGHVIATLLPLYILFAIPVAIGVAYLAPKMGRNPWLWGILVLIPVFSIIPMLIFAFMVAGAILDRLNAISDRAKNVAPST